MSSRWPRPLFYFVLLLVIAADQAVKAWIASTMFPSETFAVIPGFFNVTYVQNRGIAFGLFSGQGYIIALFMIILVVYTLYFTRALNWALLEPNLVGGLLCGGALGNLVDRFHRGYVVDFIDCHIGIHRWPTFNIADSVICIAVGWIVLRQFAGSPKKAAQS